MEYRKVLAARPPEAPEGWEIYNAPRPLYGTRYGDKVYTWQGDFIGGVFYAAIDPADPQADMWRKENKSLNATLLVFVTEQQVIDEAIAFYRENYSPQFTEKFFAKHPLGQSKTNEMLVNAWYNNDLHRSDSDG